MSDASEMLWVREQMNLRKLANQFMSKVEETRVNRVLITSVNKGDGKARFMSELAAEMSRVNHPMIPLASKNLHIVNPAHFKEQLVIVYGPSYFETEGLHTIPERWMRAFDAVVILVMARHTRSRDLLKLVNWLKVYNYQHIWPVLNEKQSPDISDFWMRLKGRVSSDKTDLKRLSRGSAASIWQPLLPPMKDEEFYSIQFEHDDIITPAKTDQSSILKTAPINTLEDNIGNIHTIDSTAKKEPTEKTGAIFSSSASIPSARATLRSSVPPARRVEKTQTDKSLMSSSFSRYSTKRDSSINSSSPEPSIKSTMISSVPPPSQNRLKSDPPQKSESPVKSSEFMQTVRQYAPSVKATMVSSVPPSKIDKTSISTSISLQDEKKGSPKDV